MNDIDFPLAAELGSATIHEAAGRSGALRPDLLPTGHTTAVAGPAFTVQCPNGDNLWLHSAIYAASPGHVIVATTGDERPLWGYWGEIMSVAARERGVVGLILEGGTRDHGELVGIGFPVWSLGRCIRGTVKDPSRVGGGMGGLIRVADIAVRPGDLVVADVDGVATIDAAEARAAVLSGDRRRTKDADVIASLIAGRTTLDLFDLN